jgi:predicted CXXCH cytochrome family protein
MKRSILVAALACVLVFAFVAGAFATTGKFYAGGVDYYRWGARTGNPAPGTGFVKSSVATLGVNAANPGAHANYLATTAKCGMCHSVHRAAGAGSMLLPTADASCAGCHAGGTAVTAKVITVGVVNMNWRKGDPTTDVSIFSSGGSGPHNDALNTLYGDGEWDGVSVPVSPSFSVEPFARYGCATRRCHATNPHGANSSKYSILAAKLLFNNSPAQDDAEYPELVAANGNGTYGGLDAVYNNLGATDASVQRFADANSGIVTLSGNQILINGIAPDPNETHALVAGLTCGRPSNAPSGEDECHAEASYAIVNKGIKENRNVGTGITGDVAGVGGKGNAYRTDNTGGEALGFGGNDHRASKTGHVAGTFAAKPGNGSYAPIAGCTSCHDQKDAANTVAGNYTFPHGQTPTGVSNLKLADGVTSATMVRSRIWAGFAGSTAAPLAVTAGTPEKAFDGQCLKCHRDGTGEGIGLTK